MAKLTVEIDCDNAAFYENDPYVQIRECLETVAHQIELARDKGIIRDSNGNVVGWYGFSREA